jgi:uncharacterized delta-60 repeat protein
MAISPVLASGSSGRPGGRHEHGRLDLTFGSAGRVVGPAWTYWDSTALAARDSEGRTVLAAHDTLVRYLADGEPDPSFGQGGALPIPHLASDGEKLFRLQGISVDRQDRLLLAGTTWQRPIMQPDGSFRSLPPLVTVIRYTSDGRLDPSFGRGGFEESTLGLPPVYEPFNPNPSGLPGPTTASVTLDRQERIVVTGLFATVAGQCRVWPVWLHGQFVTRLLADGTPEPAFGGGDGVVLESERNYLPFQPAPAPGAGGGLLLGSNSSSPNFCGEESEGPWGSVQRLLPNGAVDSRFGTGGAWTAGEELRQVAVDRSGRIVLLLGSNFDYASWESSQTTRLIRLNLDGSYDRSFGRGRNGRVDVLGGFVAMVVDHRGRIVLVGSTPSIGSRSRFVLAPAQLRPSRSPDRPQRAPRDRLWSEPRQAQPGDARRAGSSGGRGDDHQGPEQRLTGLPGADALPIPAALAAQRAQDDARPEADLRPQHHREEGQGQPGAQVGADAADAALGVEVEDHRVGEADAEQAGFADHHPPRTLAEGVRPAQVLEAAVDSGEEHSDVLLPAEDHPARDRRDQLDLGCAGGHDPANVAGLRGRPVPLERIDHAATIFPGNARGRCRSRPS